MVSRIMRGHVMAAPFPLSDRASDVRPGCKTQRIAPTLRQVADLMCARIKEREYFKTCIVGYVNCCLQCAPTLTIPRQSVPEQQSMIVLCCQNTESFGEERTRLCDVALRTGRPFIERTVIESSFLFAH
ncbi:hypothetical protein PoB_002797300 [Plakobranchus ocellatus]|uniref:Uncharacterized protein n=1 Tax=Plakobranchus ocellatus TaxID=259542 RepID=A0AAV4A4A5_9GAST|nr:hypothetical protein PoB_002797300 [Plakobranchus ocellatus]